MKSLEELTPEDWEDIRRLCKSAITKMMEENAANNISLAIRGMKKKIDNMEEDIRTHCEEWCMDFTCPSTCPLRKYWWGK